MYVQILHYIERYLSPHLFGFRKGYSTEQCLNVMLETWKKALDKKGFVGQFLRTYQKLLTASIISY